MIGGIYRITNTVNGKFYIGSARNLLGRWREHKRDFRFGRRHNEYFQRSWDRHGEFAFLFEPILYCSTTNLLMYEQLAIDALDPHYNASRVAGSRLGVPHAPETLARLRGRIRTAEHSKAISDAKKGMKPTPESRLAMSVERRARGVKPPSQKGRPQSAEHRARISAAMMGNKNTLGYKPTPEVLKKKSLLMMGNTLSKGYKYSDERRIAAYASRRKA